MEASNAESLRKMEARVTGPEKKTAELFEKHASKIINRMYLGLGAATTLISIMAAVAISLD